MSFAITNFCSQIPQNICKQAWDWVRGGGPSRAYDSAITISTRYTFFIFVLTSSFSIGYQEVEQRFIDCRFQDDSWNETWLNNLCWMRGTYLVKSFLMEPQSRQQQTAFPGVGPGLQGEVETIDLDYYSLLWLILLLCAGLHLIPHFLWKGKNSKAVEEVLCMEDGDDGQVRMFLTTCNHYTSFVYQYWIIKVVSVMMTIVTYQILVAFIGDLFLSYGIDSIMHQFKDRLYSPMEILFPVMSKCQHSHSGMGGDVEMISGYCELPLNRINGWTMLLLNLWLIFSLVYNVISCVMFMMLHIPSARRYYCRNLIRHIPNNDSVEIHASATHCLLLKLVKRNLSSDHFDRFLRELVSTDNSPIRYHAMELF